MNRTHRAILTGALALIGAAICTAQSAPPTPPAAEAWDFRGTPGEIRRTDHYRVYTTEKDAVLKDRLAQTLELALRQYRSAIVELPPPTQRLDVYLMDNRAQWEHVTKLLMGRDSEALLRIPSGGYASRGIGVYYDIGLYGTVAIAAHEGWHQYTQRTFANGLPIWLEEGLASYMEGHRWNGATPEFRPWANLERYDQLRKAHADDRLLPLEKLLTTDPKTLFAGESIPALDYYAQAWALAHFLAEGEGGKYRERLGTLLTDAAAGRLYSRLTARENRREAVESINTRLGSVLLREYFGEDLKVLNEEYLAFVARTVGVGGRDRVVRGESPVASPE